jgi:hypothetical protein
MITLDQNTSTVDDVLNIFPWAEVAPRKDSFKYLSDYVIRRIMDKSSLAVASTIIEAGIGTLTIGDDLSIEFIPHKPAARVSHELKNSETSKKAPSAMREDIKAMMDAELASLKVGCASCARSAILRKYMNLQKKVEAALLKSEM